jgi:non-homologous end joining protein Ku
VINGKLKGETVVIDEAEVPMGAAVVDLAERLRRSLEAAGGRKTKTKAKSAKRAARSGRRRAA